MDQIRTSSPKRGWTQAQKALTMNFVENVLENQALVNQTNLGMDLDVERMKKKGFELE